MTSPTTPAQVSGSTLTIDPMSVAAEAAMVAAQLTAMAVSQASITQAELVATEAAVVAAAVAVAAAAEAAMGQEDVAAAEAAAAAAIVAAAAATARAEVSAAAAVAAATVAAAAAAARARAYATASAAGNAEVAARAASQAAAAVENDRNRQAVDDLIAAQQAADTFAARSAPSGNSEHTHQLATHLTAVETAQAALRASDAAVAAATAVSHAVEIAAASAAMAVVASAAEFERSVVSTAMAAAELATTTAAAAATAVLSKVKTADLGGFGSAETPLFVQLVSPPPAQGAQAPETTSGETKRRAPFGADTHEVSVMVDDETGDYALSCQSCDWEAPRGAATLHSWRERDLDQVLLTHVDFGDLFTASPATSTASTAPYRPYPQTVSDIGRPEIFGPRQRRPAPLPRRRVFKLRTWLRP